MKKLWAIYASEQIFNGLHGMEDYAIYEGSEKDANKVGQEMSQEIMEEYPEIQEELNALFLEACDEDDIDVNSEKAKEIKEEIWADNISYVCIELDKSKIPIDISEHELERMYFNRPIEFIDRYKLV